MQYERKYVNTAGMEFGIEVPAGFVTPELPAEQTDFTDPTKSAPLAMFVSPVALALVTVAARPAYEDGTLEDWMRFLAGHYGLDVTGLISGYVGGAAHTHPCLLLECEQVQDGTALTMRIAAVEDGGRFFTVHAMCPTDLWPGFGPAFERAVASFELSSPSGPTVPCHPGCMVPLHDMPGSRTGEWPMGRGKLDVHGAKRAEERAQAMAMAAALIAKGRYDDAELLVRRADDSIQGGVALASMFESHLRDAVRAGKKGDALEEIRRRALSWAKSCFPEPHTEVEGEQQEAWWAECDAKIGAITGGRQ